METVACPVCSQPMEAFSGDNVRCVNRECKVVVLPMAQIRAKSHRDALHAQGLLRSQQANPSLPVAVPKTPDVQTVAAFVAAGKVRKTWS